MNWWVYKCNGRGKEHQNAWGDWREFFDDPESSKEDHWGSKEWVPGLAKLRPGDRVIAYQTDRNEIVGLATVRHFDKDGFLYLTCDQRIGVKVRPLKKADPLIAEIPAFLPGIIRTVYEVTAEDAERLLKAVGAEGPSEGESRMEEGSEEGFFEGERQMATKTLRNPRLREKAKREWGLSCYCCGFKYEDFYGAIGQDQAIVHHLETFSGENGGYRLSTVNDVRVVCANCHHMIHRNRTPLDVDELKETLAKSWSRWTDQGVTRKQTDY